MRNRQQSSDDLRAASDKQGRKRISVTSCFIKNQEPVSHRFYWELHHQGEDPQWSTGASWTAEPHGGAKAELPGESGFPLSLVCWRLELLQYPWASAPVAPSCVVCVSCCSAPSLQNVMLFTSWNLFSAAWNICSWCFKLGQKLKGFRL